METDTSDILGGPMLISAQESQSGWWSSLPFGAKSALVVIVSFLLYVIGARVRESYLIWREKAYKLSMRRKHGIPDTDHRPFNVAYAAVLRARQESEEKARRARLQELVQDQPTTLPNTQRRHPRSAPFESSKHLPGRYESSNNLSSNYVYASGANHARASSVQSGSQDYYNPYPAVRIADPEIDDSPSKSAPVSRNGRQYEESDDPLSSQELKVDAEEWREGEPDFGLRRGSKRGYVDDIDVDEIDDSIRIRDKRQRKVSLDKSSQLEGEDMDIDEYEDEVPALRHSRGKKRDRAEAGSTFGGDDEEISDQELDSESGRRHLRKRRTYTKRKSDVGLSRGKKRDREPAEDVSDIENEDTTSYKTSRKKRGKKSARAPEEEEQSDASVGDSLTSSSRSRPRRAIGDEWESNGVKYKIGPNGQRLRQTLVRKERQKFPMPEDSQHPDRQANLEVYVETWLSEEEYREARDNQLLAWQDSGKLSTEPPTPTAESQEDLLPVAGKNLLWNSTSGSGQTGTSTPRQITPPITPLTKQRSTSLYSSSLNGARPNPLTTAPSANKRVSSAARPSTLSFSSSPAISLSHSLSDSTNSVPRHKAFSKWEKQDLEAKAMMKMRQANKLKEEERLAKLKKEQEVAAASKVIPTITVTKADDAKPAEAKGAPLSFAPLSSTPLTDANKKETPKPPAPLFSSAPVKEVPRPVLFAPAPATSSQPPNKQAPEPVLSAKPAAALFTKADLNTFVPFGAPSPSTISSSNAPSAFTPTHSATSAATSKPSFSFGAPPLQNQPGQQADESKSNTASGAALLSRLTPTAGPQVQAVPMPASSPFEAKPPAVASTSQPTVPSSTPKFNFGLGKPPTTGPTPITGTAGPSLAKPSTGAFGFTAPSNTANSGSTTTPPVPTAPGASTDSTTAPKFSFSAPNPNLFTAKGPSTVTASNGIATPNVTANATTAAQPASVFGAGFGVKPAPEKGSSSSAFGFGSQPTATGSSTTPAPTSFGFGPATGSTPPAVAAPPQSAFGTQSTAPVQPSFSFGTKPAANASTPVAAFGAKPAADVSTPAPLFGAQPAIGTASTPGPTHSVFGTTTGAPVSSAFGSNITFGSKPSGDAPSSAAAPSAFGFGSKPSSDASSSVPAQSAFGGAFGSKPSGDASSTAAPSAFGFGSKPSSDASSSAPAQFAFGGAFGSKPSGDASSAPGQSGFAGVFGSKPSGDASSTPGQSGFAGALGSKPFGDASSAPGQSAFAGGSFGSKPSGDASSSTPGQTSFGGAGFGFKPTSNAPSAQPTFGTSNAGSNGTSTSSSFSSFVKTAGPTATPPVISKDDIVKPVFSFDAPIATPNTTPSTTPALSTTPTTQPASFSFGTTPNNAFSFGNASKTPTTESPFGKPADASAFAFPSSNNGFSAFGKVPATNGQQQQ